MMRQMTGKNSREAFTLIELLLALTVSAVILGTLTMALHVSFEGWRHGQADQDLAMHLRSAMNRIVTELRYTHKLIQAGSGVLEFDTKLLVNTDDEVERIKYEVTSSGSQSTLVRSVDGGIPYVVAGTSSGEEIVKVVSFVTQGYKLQTGSLMTLTGGDLIDIATAVEVSIVLQDEDGKTLQSSSMAYLRNL